MDGRGSNHDDVRVMFEKAFEQGPALFGFGGVGTEAKFVGDDDEGVPLKVDVDMPEVALDAFGLEARVVVFEDLDTDVPYLLTFVGGHGSSCSLSVLTWMSEDQPEHQKN